MISFINQFERVNHYFEVIKERLYVIQDKTLVQFLITGEELFRFKVGQSVSFTIIKEKIVTQDLKAHQTILLDLNNEVVKRADFLLDVYPSLKKIIFTNNYFIPIIDFKGGKSYRAKIDLSEFNVLQLFPINYGLNGIAKVLQNDRFLSFKSSTLASYSLNEEWEIWKCELSLIDNEFQKISLLEVYNDTLIVHLNNDILLGLEIDTGALKWKLALPTRILTPATFYEGKIYWFALGNKPEYLIVDIETGIIETRITPSQDILSRLVFSQPYISNHGLSLTSVSSHEIFLVDKETLEIKDIVKIEGCQNRIPIDNSPQVHGNMMYQLDGDNRLHVFEIS